MPSNHIMSRMIAIVSSMSVLPCDSARPQDLPLRGGNYLNNTEGGDGTDLKLVAVNRLHVAMSNGCATAELRAVPFAGRLVLLTLLVVALSGTTAAAQSTADPVVQPAATHEKRIASVLPFLAGGAIGLATHEAGHVFFDVLFEAKPGLRKVDFHGIPFFAITHRNDLSPRREFTISSAAGFWVQHGESEWLLTRRSRLRHEHAPVAKGILAFDILSSVAYSGAAFARTGPEERDTRGMATSARVDERWIGALILAPAILDTVRYFNPGAKWATWASRGVKVGVLLMVVR
jgi:hypothetical protein